MVDYISKWNNYTIGEIPWINYNRYHPARTAFYSFVELYREHNKNIKIVEVGAGECTEAKFLKDSVDYTVVDVSDTFLDNAKNIGLKTIKSDIMNLDKNVTEKYDICYCCNVIEHAPEIYGAIENIKKIANMYFVTMFRWCYNGNMKHNLYSKNNKTFYTSTFDIDRIFKLFGNVRLKTICTRDGSMIPYEEYEKTINKEDTEHRTGNWLSFCGEAK